MKKILVISAILLSLVSCSKKDVLLSEDSISAVVASESAHTDYVWNWHTITSEWNDASAYVKQDGLNLWCTDSWGENLVYERAWKNVYVPLKSLNRGIGGTTHMQYLPYLAKCRQYAPRVNSINLHFGTNEYLQGKQASLQSDFNRFFDSVAKWFPKAQINVHQIELSPKFYYLGLRQAIENMNIVYENKVKEYVKKGGKATIVRTYNTLLKNGLPDVSLYKPDSVHPNTSGYLAMQDVITSSIKNIITPVDTSTTITPTPFPTGVAIANAGPDQFIPKSWNYCRLNANASTAPAGYWIKAFKWTQIQGPKLTFQNQNTGNTLIYGMQVGEYVFRVAVTDSKNGVTYDDVKVTFTLN